MTYEIRSIEQAQSALECLEFDYAFEFAEEVTARLRRLNDAEINALYLLTHTDANLGERVDERIAVLMPLIEKEFDLRRDLTIVPYIGPVVAPDLYRKGGGHYAPF